MNRFEYKAEKLTLEAEMARLQAELYAYLIRIDVNVKPAERLSESPTLTDFGDSFEPHEMEIIRPLVIQYRKLHDKLYALKH